MPSTRRGTFVRSTAVAVTVAASMVLTGCGDDTAADDLRAACGPIEFDAFPADLDGLPPLDDDARAAIDELANGETAVEAAGFDTDYEWSIASRTDDSLELFGQSGPAGESAYAYFSRVGSAWRPSGWGGCWVEAEAPGFGPASVAFDPDRPIEPTSTEVPVLIQERECASGQAPVDREIAPVVLETDDSVTVIVLVASVRGDAECPSNPWHPITVTLDEPLGDRVLLDGHRPPAVPLGPPA